MALAPNTPAKAEATAIITFRIKSQVDFFLLSLFSVLIFFSFFVIIFCHFEHCEKSEDAHVDVNRSFVTMFLRMTQREKKHS